MSTTKTATVKKQGELIGLSKEESLLIGFIEFRIDEISKMKKKEQKMELIGFTWYIADECRDNKFNEENILDILIQIIESNGIEINIDDVMDDFFYEFHKHDILDD